MDASLFELVCIVPLCMRAQVNHSCKWQQLCRRHEISQLALAEFTESLEHKVVCEDHHSEKEVRVAIVVFWRNQLVRVQILDDTSEVLPRDASDFNSKHLVRQWLKILVEQFQTFVGWP